MAKDPAFRRRISSNGKSVDVELPAGVARWLPAQHHSGENTGETDTHTFFVEHKESAQHPVDAAGHPGPSDS
jgi:hypothetical protein